MIIMKISLGGLMGHPGSTLTGTYSQRTRLMKSNTVLTWIGGVRNGSSQNAQTSLTGDYSLGRNTSARTHNGTSASDLTLLPLILTLLP